MAKKDIVSQLSNSEEKIRYSEKLLDESAGDYLLIYRDPEGINFVSPNRTWAIGAAHRFLEKMTLLEDL